MKTVFLDLDGVLVDFVGGLHKLWSIPYDLTNYPYEKAKWDMLLDIPGVDNFSEVDDACDREFWHRLNWIHDGRDIFKHIFDRFTNDIYLLTTPMSNLGSWTGKALWVNRNIPVFNKRLIITSASKSLLAGPGTLLIDDRDKNVEEFIAAGGNACLVPRPWNKGYAMADKSADIVKAFLEELK